MNKEEALQVFDGLMLGDGSLEYNGGYPHYAMALSAGNPAPWIDREHEAPQYQYLVYIKDCLEDLEVKFGPDQPQEPFIRYYQSGVPYLYYGLRSLYSKFLATQFKRWYRPVTSEIREVRGFNPSRRWYKVIPNDVKLTPRAMAVWFEGDGGTKRDAPNVMYLRLATHGFDFEENERLCSLLSVFNIQAYPTKHMLNKYGVRFWNMQIGAIDSINAFFNLTEEYIHPCYRYKIRKAMHMSEARIIAQAIENHQFFSNLQLKLKRSKNE